MLFCKIAFIILASGCIWMFASESKPDKQKSKMYVSAINEDNRIYLFRKCRNINKRTGLPNGPCWIEACALN